MLSQEFPLPEVLTIWDALLTDDSRYNYKCYCEALDHLFPQLRTVF